MTPPRHEADVEHHRDPDVHVKMRLTVSQFPTFEFFEPSRFIHVPGSAEYGAARGGWKAITSGRPENRATLTRKLTYHDARTHDAAIAEAGGKAGLATLNGLTLVTRQT
nr:hypothetical protein [Paraburkholderia sp. BL8N3]